VAGSDLFSSLAILGSCRERHLGSLVDTSEGMHNDLRMEERRFEIACLLLGSTIVIVTRMKSRSVDDACHTLP
jgi:hypothetical protein